MATEPQQQENANGLRVLIVEDDANVAEVVDLYLKRDGYQTHRVGDGRNALERMNSVGADVVVLDVMLPGLDGLSVARKMREAGDRTPIIMLTARGQESDVVLGLELGADDYKSKPFSPAELVARVHAVLRRTGTISTGGPPVSIGDNIVISSHRHTVTRAGEELALTHKEFELLYFLATNPGTVYTREQLLERVWGYEHPGDTSTVTVHIRRLRSKIEADPENPAHIKTVWGVGYRFDAE